ncbi:MAG TPA: ABC transporter permease [Chloroflexota bacterium]
MTATDATKPIGADLQELRRPRTSYLGDVWRRLLASTLARVGLAIVLLFIAAAFLAPVLTPQGPTEQTLIMRLKPPSMEHPFGMDHLGRDVFSRVIYGAQISLRIGIVSVMLGLVFGTVLGLVAGYLAGWTDTVIMRFMDIMLAFPSTLLAIAIVAARGPGLDNTILAVGVVAIPIYARITRGTVLSVKESDYVLAARSLGAQPFRMMTRHILPNCLSPIIVQATLGFATAVISAAALGFLGLGAQPPTPEWGAMLADSYQYLVNAPWALFFPGGAIMLTVLGFNLLGDGLRDALDPRTR